LLERVSRLDNIWLVVITYFWWIKQLLLTRR